MDTGSYQRNHSRARFRISPGQEALISGDPNRTSFELHLPDFHRLPYALASQSVATSTLIEGSRGQASPLGQG
jgi:hypothetical protein